MSDKNQISMFEALGVEEEWRKEWQDMPEFERVDNMPFQKISVNFKTKEDVKAFAALLGIKISFDTDTIWFPAKQKIETGVYIDEP